MSTALSGPRVLEPAVEMTSREEERYMDVLTSLAGILLALVAWIWFEFWIRGTEFVSMTAMASMLAAGRIYLGVFFGVFLASTFYHWSKIFPWVVISRRTDRAAIFWGVWATGEYHIALLPAIAEERVLFGWSAVSVARLGTLLLAIVGTTTELSLGKRANVFVNVLYVLQGATIVVAADFVGMFSSANILPWLLVWSGVAFYLLGFGYFYRLQNDPKRRFYHSYWHLMVIGGFTCGFLAGVFAIATASSRLL